MTLIQSIPAIALMCSHRQMCNNVCNQLIKSHFCHSSSGDVSFPLKVLLEYPIRVPIEKCNEQCNLRTKQCQNVQMYKTVEVLYKLDEIDNNANMPSEALLLEKKSVTKCYPQ